MSISFELSFYTLCVFVCVAKGINVVSFSAIFQLNLMIVQTMRHFILCGTSFWLNIFKFLLTTDTMYDLGFKSFSSRVVFYAIYCDYSFFTSFKFSIAIQNTQLIENGRKTVIFISLNNNHRY